jgi:hypothetical protein
VRVRCQANPHRPGISLALGLRAEMSGVSVIIAELLLQPCYADPHASFNGLQPRDVQECDRHFSMKYGEGKLGCGETNAKWLKRLRAARIDEYRRGA